MKKIAILGSTGSIGTQTLDVVEANPERLQAAALAAHKNDVLLEAQIRKFHPSVAALSDPEAAQRLRSRYQGPTEILSGPEGVMAVAMCSEADTVLGAMVGYAGLRPTLAAIQAGDGLRRNRGGAPAQGRTPQPGEERRVREDMERMRRLMEQMKREEG